MNHWTICLECEGQGKKSRKLSKKAKRRYQLVLDDFKNNKDSNTIPVKPKRPQFDCLHCNGSGLIPAKNPTVLNTEQYPHVAIIGGGIGGTALAIACLHRGIPFTLYERDDNFNSRSQGYGLTLQQASKAIKALGILELKEGIVSSKHVVHNTNGKVLGEWGMRKWMPTDNKKSSKKTNIHISRQALRLALLEQLSGKNMVQWNHKLIDFKHHKNKSVDLTFLVNGETKNTKADLVVGADGIRSKLRQLLIGEKVTPLRYLDCIVILGICPLDSLKNLNSELLDGSTVFQTANGNERIYMMPYNENNIMWQLSFPIPENEAKTLSTKGQEALKKEAIKRTQWHSPIPEIIEATSDINISGYPVYDRTLLSSKLLENAENITLIGDAAHPMSPFKGQGANQALLDALSLARDITKGCKPNSQWQTFGIRKNVLSQFEANMLKRSAKKVKDSAKAAEILHSNVVLEESNQPRGSIKQKDV